MEKREQVIAVSHLEARLQAIEDEIRRLTVERDVLRRIVATAPRMARDMVPASPARTIGSAIAQAMAAGVSAGITVASSGAAEQSGTTASSSMTMTASPRVIGHRATTFQTLPENVAREKPRTERIVDYVRDVPGQTSGEIADVLVRSGMAATAAEPKKLIQTVLGQLVSQGRLRRDEDGRFYVVA